MSRSTEIVVIMDQSGSMNAIKDDAIGGFNAFLEAQQKEPGEARLTLVLFDTVGYVERHISTPLAEVQPLSDATYKPCGGTPLLDAIGNTVKKVDERLAEQDTPRQGHEDARKMDLGEESEEDEQRVIVAVLTDGQENSSTSFTKDAIAKLITEHEEKGWAFLFLAANMDAVGEARSLNIQSSNAEQWTGGQGLRCAYMGLSAATKNYRSGGSGALHDANQS